MFAYVRLKDSYTPPSKLYKKTLDGITLKLRERYSFGHMRRKLLGRAGRGQPTFLPYSARKYQCVWPAHFWALNQT